MFKVAAETRDKKLFFFGLIQSPVNLLVMFIRLTHFENILSLLSLVLLELLFHTLDLFFTKVNLSCNFKGFSSLIDNFKSKIRNLILKQTRTKLLELSNWIKFFNLTLRVNLKEILFIFSKLRNLFGEMQFLIG